MNLSLIFLLTVSVLVADVFSQQQICNNAAALCDRKYDNVTHLGAHDSPFVRNVTNGYSVAGDQIYTSVQQLDSGVRLLSAQVHKVTTTTGYGSEDEWRLCHTLCELYDAGPLVDWLVGVKGWLDGNPSDVVTILLVNSDDADAATLGGIYQQAGLDAYSYQPATKLDQATSDWPTLSDMITQKKRLVNFVANLDPTTNQAAPYLLDEFTFVFENNYDNVDPDSFSCEPNRPSTLIHVDTPSALANGYMPLMNHFRYDNLSGVEIPSVENVNATNAPTDLPGNLGDAAANCTQFYGKAPTFILTDFTNVGPAIETVDRLNGVEGQTSGRLILPDTIADSMLDPSPTSQEPSPTLTSSTVASSASGSSSATTSSVSMTSSSSSSSSSSASRSSSIMSLNQNSFASVSSLLLVMATFLGVFVLII